MLLNQSATNQGSAKPVIIGSGLIGLAISRSLSAAGISHVLVGGRPTTTPRLGESLNAEGSLEIARQFPDLSRFFFRKRQQALFFGDQVLSFDSLQTPGGLPYPDLLGYPGTVPLLHVDRVGFDRALFEIASADKHCQFVADRAVAVDYHPVFDRVDGLTLASGDTLTPSYVFDVSNHLLFLARKLGIRQNVIGAPRRVVFAHYRRDAVQPPIPPTQQHCCLCGRAALLLRSASRMLCSVCDGATATQASTGTGTTAAAPTTQPAASPSTPPWLQATALLRLESGQDALTGLAWCIPLGDYVSVGISVAAAITVSPAALLDAVEQAYARRGIAIRTTFPNRGAPQDIRYEHYDHERCYGRNWLLAGPSCCQFWFPSASGVATGLVAARLAPDLLNAPLAVESVYQDYINQLAASHGSLDWLANDDPRTVDAETLRQRAEAMVRGNVKRLGRYLGLQQTATPWLVCGALARVYEDDRRKANPIRIESVPPEAQSTWLFAKSQEPWQWAEEANAPQVLARTAKLDAPEAVMGIIDLLSGQRDIATSASLVAQNFSLRIDEFILQGIAPWTAWATFLRGATQLQDLRLVPGSSKTEGGKWVLDCQWQGVKGGRQAVSPVFPLTFAVKQGLVQEIDTQRADYAFAVGSYILPRMGFVGLLRRLASGEATV